MNQTQSSIIYLFCKSVFSRNYAETVSFHKNAVVLNWFEVNSLKANAPKIRFMF